MAVNVRKRDDVTILDLKGKITIGATELALREAVHSALDSGAKKIVINMQGVTTIDSSGIGELVSAYTSATHRGAKIRLACLPEKVQSVLVITQLYQVFDVDDTEDQSCAGF